MLIDMLGKRLMQYGSRMMSASGDADLLLTTSDIVLVGDDTDVLVLLCFITKYQHNTIYI